MELSLRVLEDVPFVVLLNTIGPRPRPLVSVEEREASYMVFGNIKMRLSYNIGPRAGVAHMEKVSMAALLACFYIVMGCPSVTALATVTETVYRNAISTCIEHMHVGAQVRTACLV